MDDSTDKVPTLDWSLPDEADEEEEVLLDFDTSDADDDGEVWEWDGTTWIAVHP
jgi:hypothetical protein